MTTPPADKREADEIFRKLRDFVDAQKPLPADFAKILQDNFWELCESPPAAPQEPAAAAGTPTPRTDALIEAYVCDWDDATAWPNLEKGIRDIEAELSDARHQQHLMGVFADRQREEYKKVIADIRSTIDAAISAKAKGGGK